MTLVGTIGSLMSTMLFTYARNLVKLTIDNTNIQTSCLSACNFDRHIHERSESGEYSE